MLCMQFRLCTFYHAYRCNLFSPCMLVNQLAIVSLRWIDTYDIAWLGVRLEYKPRELYEKLAQGEDLTTNHSITVIQHHTIHHEDSMHHEFKAQSRVQTNDTEIQLLSNCDRLTTLSVHLYVIGINRLPRAVCCIFADCMCAIARVH